MRPVQPREQQQRRARFESFEERLAMSAQPLQQLGLAVRDVSIEHHYGELTPAPTTGLPGGPAFDGLEQAAGISRDAAVAWSIADNLTGLTGVRTNYGFSGSGQTIAVIDSGIAYDHRALGGGYGAGARVVGGWDFAENDANPYDDGPAGFHGTHVAGIIGSSDATYRGVASGVDLVALRVFDDQGNGNFNWVERALQWVHQRRNDFANPITTVNLSLGAAWNGDSPPNWATLEDEFAQLERDGIFISVSAGNSFTSYSATGLSYPAASSYVVPVASVDNNGQLSSFSQRHARVVAAPGRGIVSTIPDFVTGGDGIANDFAGASGTSMAAPYVAGASALVRQAMQFVGYSSITQDVIYDHIRQTADVIYDTVTQANYFRLNIGAAINALIPQDDYGSTANTSYALGTLNAPRELPGLIGSLQDQDFFTFTAGYSGTASFRIAARQELVSHVSLVGGGGTVANDTLTFNVVAGQSYTVSLGTRAGLGRYTATIGIEQSAAANLGVIDFHQIADQSFRGEQTMEWTASRSGVLTVEAVFAHASGDINLELYDASNKLIKVSRSLGNVERIDVSATSGQVFRLKVMGNNSDVDLKVANLVSVSGSRLIVHGTSGDDSFAFSTATNHEVAVNGITYSFSAKVVRSVEFQGGGGRDSIRAAGGSGNETFTVKPTTVDVASKTYSLKAAGVEDIVVSAGAGSDVVYLYDSNGNDRLEARPTSVVLSAENGSYTSRADGFDVAYIYATSGIDQAHLFDSAGNDRFTATPSYALMQGPKGTYLNYAAGFDSCFGYASTGTDMAFFHDSRGDDRFIAAPNSGAMSDVRGTYANQGEGFDYVYGFSTSGGNDSAMLYDSAGNDIFTSTIQASLLRGARYEFNTYVSGFRNLEVRAVNGGQDVAVISDVSSSDKLVGRAKDLAVVRSANKSLLTGFSRIAATAQSRAIASADVTAVDYLFQKIGRWK